MTRPRLAACALAAGALLVGCGGSGPGTSTTTINAPAAPARAAGIPAGDWPSFDYNPERSGVGPAATGITPANLGQLRLRRVRIDGIADSPAIELHGVKVRGRRRDVIFVTTSYGKTIAIDPGRGTKLWEFVPHGVNDRPGNFQVTTATPVADPNRRFVYAASPNGVVYKLAVPSGRPVWARPITLDPRHEKIAGSLNLSGRLVVAATGGYIGDIPPYDGHVVTIDRTSGRIVGVWNSQCSARRELIAPASCPGTDTHGNSAIWARAGVVIEPGSRRMLLATGNGPFDGRFNWGNSVLELSPDAARPLHSWTPANQAQLSAGDVDVGSTAPALLGTYHGRHLAVQAGKDGKLHLLDLARLNGTTGGPGRRLGGEVQVVSAPGGGQVFTAPMVWSNRGRPLVVVATDSGTGAYRLIGGARPRLRAAWRTANAGTSPVLAGGLLYIYNEADGTLDVRNPASGMLLRSLPLAPGHWNSPIVVGGRIIEPTGSYHDSSATSTIAIYHLPGR